MPSSADIISFAARAKQSLAAARSAGEDGAHVAHLEQAVEHGEQSVPADGAKPVDIAFPLRSIPKWVPIRP